MTTKILNITKLLQTAPELVRVPSNMVGKKVRVIMTQGNTVVKDKEYVKISEKVRVPAKAVGRTIKVTFILIE